MVSFSPFRIKLRIATPVIVGQVPVHLDGLLAYCLYAWHPDWTTEQINDDLAKTYLLRHDNRFFHGSSMAFGVTPSRWLSATTQTRVGRLRNEQLESDWFTPNGRGDRYVKIVTLGGPTKVRFNTRNAYAADWVVFDGVGDGQACAALIDHFVLGLGMEANSGGTGAIVEVSWSSLNEDHSLVCEGMPARSLPLSLANSLRDQGAITSNFTTGRGPLLAPYWGCVTGAVDIALSPRIRTVRLA